MPNNSGAEIPDILLAVLHACAQFSTSECGKRWICINWSLGVTVKDFAHPVTRAKLGASVVNAGPLIRHCVT